MLDLVKLCRQTNKHGHCPSGDGGATYQEREDGGGMGLGSSSGVRVRCLGESHPPTQQLCGLEPRRGQDPAAQAKPAER